MMFGKIYLFICLIILSSITSRRLRRIRKQSNISIPVDKHIPFHLNERISGFTPALPLYFQKFIPISYCNSEEIANNNCCMEETFKEGWIRVKQFAIDIESESKKKLLTIKGDKKYNFQAFVNLNNKKVLFLFPGTRNGFTQLYYEGNSSNMKRLINNFAAVSYFYDLYSIIREEVIRAITFEIADFVPDIDQFQYIFEGHSLGGAIATWAAYDYALLQKEKKKKIEDSPVLITFGSPSIGNKELVNDVNASIKHIFRIAADFDIVTYLPPWGTPTKGYIRVSEDGTKMIDCEKNKENRHCTISFFKSAGFNHFNYFEKSEKISITESKNCEKVWNNSVPVITNKS